MSIAQRSRLRGSPELENLWLNAGVGAAAGRGSMSLWMGKQQPFQTIRDLQLSGIPIIASRQMSRKYRKQIQRCWILRLVPRVSVMAFEGSSE